MKEFKDPVNREVPARIRQNGPSFWENIYMMKITISEPLP
jgi:hypothetical protein